MDHGNMMTINLDLHRYSRVRPRRKKQGYLRELLEIKNNPCLLYTSDAADE